MSAFAHTPAGNTVCVSIICCWSLSCSCTMSGRSPVPSPALYFWNVASQSIWLTSVTFTSFCDELNASVRLCSAASFSRGIQCHIVISTGFDAFFSAANGHVVLFAAPARRRADHRRDRCATITVARPETVQRLHDRMPIIPSPRRP